MSLIKKLAGETALYGLSSIVGRVLNYLLVPLYSAYFLPDEYAPVAIMMSYAAFLNVVFTFGMETAYFRHAGKTPEKAQEIFNECFTFLAVLTFIFMAAGTIYSNDIARWVGYPQYPDRVVLILSIVAVDALAALAFAKLRLAGKAVYFVAVKILSIFINIGMNLYLVAGCSASNFFLSGLCPDRPANANDVFVANLVANAIALLFLLPLWRGYRPRWTSKLTTVYFPYAWPIMITGLAGMVNEVLDRIMLQKLLPENFYPGRTTEWAIGVYGACYKLSIFMSLAIQSFRFASEPFFFSNAANRNSPELFAKVMHWFVIACSGMYLVISLKLDVLQFILINPEYRYGLNIVPILLMANLFLGVTFNLSVWYKLSDRTLSGTWITLFGAIITLLINYLLIPVMGFMGSAWATLLCYGSMMVLSYILGQSVFKIPYCTGAAIFYVVLAIVLYMGSTRFNFGFWANQFRDFITVAIFALVIYLKEFRLKNRRVMNY